MAIEPEMIEGVKKLLAEGHKPENVKENLAKLGYGPQDVESIMKQAQTEEFDLEPAPKPAPKATKAPVVAAEEEALEGFQAGPPLSMGSEEDLMLQSSSGMEMSPEIEEEAESLEMGPSVAKPMPPPRPKYAQKAPLPAQETLTEDSGDEPPKRTGATIFIVLVVIVVLGVLAVTIALPKLGINLL